MKSLIAAAAAVVTVAAIPAVSLAQDNSGTQVYGTIGYAGVKADDASLGAIQGRLGARFGNYWGVEGEVAGGVNDDTVTVLGTPVNVELKHQVAGYAVGYLPIQPNFDLFARVGYGSSKIKASAGGASAVGDGDSINYGVGGQYFFTDKDGVRADYTKHDFRDDGGDADVWSVSYVRKF